MYEKSFWICKQTHSHTPHCLLFYHSVIFLSHFSFASFSSHWLIASRFKMFGKQSTVYVTFQHQNEKCFWRGKDLNVNNQNTFPLQIHHTRNVFANLEKSLHGSLYNLTWYLPVRNTNTIVGKKHSEYMNLGFIYVSSVTSVSFLPHSFCMYPPLPLSFLSPSYFSRSVSKCTCFSCLESLYGVLQWMMAQSFR